MGMKFDESIRNNSKLIGENIKNLKPNQELSKRYKDYFENPKHHLGICTVSFFFVFNQFG